jgi:signal transduction histidine kinase
MRPTIRLRLTAWYGAIFLLAGGALLAVSYAIVSRTTFDFSARVAEEMVRQGGGPVPIQTQNGGASVPQGLGGARAAIPDAALPKAVRTELAKEARRRAAAERKVRAQMRRDVSIYFAFALAGTTLLSLLAGWVVAGRALRPVSRITATARRVAAGADLSERIAPTGPADELRELAETFDQMLERLERAFAAQRGFVANASHELRTPLAVMRAEIEDRLTDPGAGEEELRQMGAVVQEAVARAEGLISSLLVLARSQNGLRRHDRVDLGDVAHLVVGRLAPDLERRAISVELPNEGTTLDADGDLIERLVWNLVDNALRYNREGGFIRVAIEERDHSAVLSVRNSGQTIPAEAAPRLFEPFFRVDDSRSRESGGAGLGLAIVAAIAEAHGGSAGATPGVPDGLTVAVTFPTETTKATSPLLSNHDQSSRLRLHERKAKAGSSVFGLVHLDSASVALGDLPDDREAEP